MEELGNAPDLAGAHVRLARTPTPQRGLIHIAMRRKDRELHAIPGVREVVPLSF